MPCAECGNNPGAVFHVAGRELCGRCLELLYSEDVLREMFPMRRTEEEQEALNRRVAEKQWLRLVNLPGYAQWSAQYQGLNRIIHDLENYHVLVHPDEFNRPLDEKFEGIFQGWLDDYADRGAPCRKLSEYKKA
jgi:hypothetical protein